MLVQYLARRQHVSLIMPQPSRNPNCTMHSPRPRGQHPRHAPVWTWNSGTWSIISRREGARRSQTHTELRASSLESVILIYDVGSGRRYFTHFEHLHTRAHTCHESICLPSRRCSWKNRGGSTRGLETPRFLIFVSEARFRCECVRWELVWGRGFNGI